MCSRSLYYTVRGENPDQDQLLLAATGGWKSGYRDNRHDILLAEGVDQVNQRVREYLYTLMRTNSRLFALKRQMIGEFLVTWFEFVGPSTNPYAHHALWRIHLPRLPWHPPSGILEFEALGEMVTS